MRSTVLFSLGLPLIVACGDDGGVTRQDAATDSPNIDARDIDAAVPGFAGFQADEGGEVRTEYIKFPNGGIATRTTAFVFKNSGTTKFFDFVNQNGCTDTRDLTRWPLATNPIAEREYHDIGSSVVIVGGPQPLTVPKKTNASPPRDPFNREHGVNNWYFDPAANTMADPAGGVTPVPNTEAALYLTEKTIYDVVFPGSATFPAQIFDNGIYMPAAFDLNDSAHPHSGGTFGLVMPPATEQTFTWTTPTDTPPTGVIIWSLVAFTGANGPAVVCVEPNDGSITVPAAMMDVARTVYPTGGTIARQTFSHQVRELADANGLTKRRVDLIGVWCYAGTTYAANPQCSDGVNNDVAEDTLIDFPADPGCSSLSDTTELGNP